MRRSIVLVIAGVMGVGVGSAGAQEADGGVEKWLSANVAIVSDYSFRGISQTDREPAIQGGLDVQHPSGVYLGTWGSSVNFGEDLAAGPRAQMELDVYGGIRRSLGRVVDADLGAVYYAYPGAAGGRDYNYLEYGLGLSRDVAGASAGVSARYSPEFFGASGTAMYLGGEVELPLSAITLIGSIGHQWIEDNATFGTPDYLDYGVGIGVGWGGFQVTGQVLATDLEDSACFAGTDLCRARLVLGVSRAM